MNHRANTTSVNNLKSTASARDAASGVSGSGVHSRCRTQLERANNEGCGCAPNRMGKGGFGCGMERRASNEGVAWSRDGGGSH